MKRASLVFATGSVRCLLWITSAALWPICGCSTSATDQAPADGGYDGGPPDGGGAPAHFSTVPPHGLLPSEDQCAAWVSSQPTPETVPANQSANQTTPTQAWLSDLHAIPLQGTPTEAADIAPVTGNFTGSTDMILRWAACKWGVDEDVVRAEAYEESSWRQSLAADDDAVCHSRNVPTTALNYWSEPSPCHPSKGILQIKLIFFNAFPYAESSTALNADYRMARQRTCMNGDISWLYGQTSTDWGTYPPSTTDGALYGCMGQWFSGGWGDSGAVNYVQQLKTILANRSWPH